VATRILNADPKLRGALDRRRREWTARDGTRRLWARDRSLWTGGGEERSLGWLDVEDFGRLKLLAGGRPEDVATGDLGQRLAGRPFDRCLLLGMGGSALGADLLWRALPRQVEAEFLVLDTTDPRELTAALDGVPPDRLRVIAASKSGGTLETTLAFELLLHLLGDAARSCVVAVTDPGSALEARALSVGAPVVLGRPDVGGRFSVLSAFGTTPAAIAGIDVDPLLRSALRMASACQRDLSERDANPGVELGLLLAAAHDCGRDKLHLHAPPTCGPLIGWVEQLIAESLGKGGVLLLPVEAAGLPVESRSDRVDVLLGSASGKGTGAGSGPGEVLEAEIPASGPAALVEATLPADLGGESFRWEFATAVAGALLGINPFNQPDVEASKIVTRRYVERIRAGHVLPPGAIVRLDELSDLGLAELLGTHLATLPPGGYAVVSAWVDRTVRNRELLQALRVRIARLTRAASVLGFGPGFLHSTGQLHKGGPNRGLFFQITADPPVADLPVPGESLTFGQVQLAQARGDHDVLVERSRRVLGLHLGSDVEAGLLRLLACLSD